MYNCEKCKENIQMLVMGTFAKGVTLEFDTIINKP